MLIKIELKNESIDKDALTEDINARFQSVCVVRADGIEFVASGTIPTGCKVITDKRVWK